LGLEVEVGFCNSVVADPVTKLDEEVAPLGNARAVPVTKTALLRTVKVEPEVVEPTEMPRFPEVE